MLFKQLIEAFDIIDSKNVNGNSVASYLKSIKQDADIQVYPLVGPKGSTDMLKIRIPGLHGKTSGGDAPTIGLLGRLGGLGARPERIGYVSDGDGALVVEGVSLAVLHRSGVGSQDGAVRLSEVTYSFLHIFVRMHRPRHMFRFHLWDHL